MITRTRTAVLLVAGTLLLAGCTGGDDDASDGGDKSASGQAAGQAAGGGAADPGTANAADQVMAEQKIATPHGAGEARGGEVTVTLRSVEAGSETMTVRWALQWDDDDSPADASARYYDMGVVPATTVTDRGGLKAYKPFCTDGAWQEDTESLSDAGIAQIQCRESMLVSPLDKFFGFPNHGTVEVSAVLPAPDGSPTTVDVTPGDGLPMFTDATVTYLDGAEDGGDE